MTWPFSSQMYQRRISAAPRGAKESMRSYKLPRLLLKALILRKLSKSTLKFCDVQLVTSTILCNQWRPASLALSITIGVAVKPPWHACLNTADTIRNSISAQNTGGSKHCRLSPLYHHHTCQPVRLEIMNIVFWKLLEVLAQAPKVTIMPYLSWSVFLLFPRWYSCVSKDYSNNCSKSDIFTLMSAFAMSIWVFVILLSIFALTPAPIRAYSRLLPLMLMHKYRRENDKSQHMCYAAFSPQLVQTHIHQHACWLKERVKSPDISMYTH